ncbi:MAG TPA: glycine cleavage system aminomethyltransferase GcvT [Thermoleophilia bacterium]|nr:glycine cleavage system aminomethyltransferase GcvT [Thermoleophilia bacterium]
MTLTEPNGSTSMSQDRPEGGSRHLTLEDEHIALGARFAVFAGWRMPTMYTSIIDEHLRVRTSAGLFDVSHMGRLLLRGRDALRTVQRLVASDISDLGPGQARYTVLLTTEGGILDDLIVYRREDGILLVVNAGNTAEDRDWIGEHLAGDTTLDDLTDITGLFALQGPAALNVIETISSAGASSLAPFTFTAANVAGVEATVMRTGYTGEQGVELLTARTDAVRLWRALLEFDGGALVAPCGLGARDTLRLEAALLLHGRDIDRSTTPYEARLGRLVDLDRKDGSDFAGRAALLRAAADGPTRLLVGLANQARTIPRSGDSIHVDGRRVGTVTSGSLSPVLGHPIALGYVEPEAAQTGTEVSVIAGTKTTPARIVDRPFYRRGETPIPSRARRAPSSSHRPGSSAAWTGSSAAGTEAPTDRPGPPTAGPTEA